MLQVRRPGLRLVEAIDAQQDLERSQRHVRQRELTQEADGAIGTGRREGHGRLEQHRPRMREPVLKELQARLQLFARVRADHGEVEPERRAGLPIDELAEVRGEDHVAEHERIARRCRHGARAFEPAHNTRLLTPSPVAPRPSIWRGHSATPARPLAASCTAPHARYEPGVIGSVRAKRTSPVIDVPRSAAEPASRYGWLVLWIACPSTSRTSASIVKSVRKPPPLTSTVSGAAGAATTTATSCGFGFAGTRRRRAGKRERPDTRRDGARPRRPVDGRERRSLEDQDRQHARRANRDVALARLDGGVTPHGLHVDRAPRCRRAPSSLAGR